MARRKRVTFGGSGKKVSFWVTPKMRSEVDVRIREALEFLKHYQRLIKKYGSLKYAPETQVKKLEKLGMENR